MAYTRGDSANVIVGAAAVFIADIETKLPAPIATESYAETLSNASNASVVTNDGKWRNVGYTSNGLELQFAPEFGEVQVDQLLDVAKMYKSGMTVTLNTSFAEATLDNLAVAIAQSYPVDDAPIADHDKGIGTTGNWTGDVLNLTSGKLGECPMERKLIAVGPGGGDCDADNPRERVYTAFRVLSIDSVTASAKRDEASIFDVSFRLFPNGKGVYGQIVDRVYQPGGSS